MTVKWSCSVKSDSVTPWTVVCQAPPHIGFPRQEYWSGLPFPSPGDLLDHLGLPHCRQTLYHLGHQEARCFSAQMSWMWQWLSFSMSLLLIAWPKDGTPIAQESLEVLLKLQNLGLNIIERHNRNFLFNCNSRWFLNQNSEELFFSHSFHQAFLSGGSSSP